MEVNAEQHDEVIYSFRKLLRIILPMFNIVVVHTLNELLQQCYSEFVNEAFITFPDDFLKVKLYPKNTAIAANPTIFA